MIPEIKIFSHMKHGDACIPANFHLYHESLFSSPLFSEGIVKANTGTAVSVSCNLFMCHNINCKYYNQKNSGAKTYGIFLSEYNFFKKEYENRIVCIEDSYVRMKEKHARFEFIADVFTLKASFCENALSSGFRRDPVPGTGGWNKSRPCNNGRSKKGLQFASYRYIEDCQEISYDEESFETYQFLDNKLKNSRCYSGMGFWSFPQRHQEKKSWKRTKKEKQWM